MGVIFFYYSISPISVIWTPPPPAFTPIFFIEISFVLPPPPGFSSMLHYQTSAVPCVVTRIVSTISRSSGKVLQKKPRCAEGQLAISILHHRLSTCLSTFTIVFQPVFQPSPSSFNLHHRLSTFTIVLQPLSSS